MRTGNQTDHRPPHGPDVRAKVRRGGPPVVERCSARAEGDRAAPHAAGRWLGRPLGRPAARHRALARNRLGEGGDHAVADRAKYPSVLRLVLPALLVAAFILASTPAAEAHNTWTGAYGKWPWTA